MTEVGSGRLVDELDDALIGMLAGETKTIALPAEEGATTDVDLTLKEMKEPRAARARRRRSRASASEFDTLEELRADVEARLREQIEDEAEAAFREAAVDALVEATRVRRPGRARRPPRGGALAGHRPARLRAAASRPTRT